MALTSNYTTEAAKATGDPFVFAQIGGVGHTEASGAEHTKFSSYLPPSTYTGYADFKDYLDEEGGNPRYSLDSLRPSDGSSDAGTCEFVITDFGDFVSARLGYMRPGIPVAGSYPTLLDEDITRTETAWTVTDDGAISVGDMVFANNEAVYVSGVAANVLTVVRAQWGTIAQKHYTGDSIRAVMVQPKGQVVEVYRNFTNLTNADEGIRWRGLLTNAEQTEDGIGWRIQAQSILTMLDVDVMRRQGNYQIKSYITNNSTTSNAEDFDLRIEATDPDFGTFADSQTKIYVATSGPKGVLYVLRGSTDALTTIRVLSDEFDHTTRFLANLREWGEFDAGEANDALWEVAPVDQSFPSGRFGSSHPFKVALTWMLSITGDTTNGSYDVLPEGWGGEVPVAFVNTTSFEDLAERIPADVSNMVYGYKGDQGFGLRQHLEEELLGPYGVHIVQIDGQLTLVQYAASPAWQTSAAVSVTHDHIVEDTIPANSIDLSDAVQTALLETGYSWIHEKFLTRVNAYQKKREAFSLYGGRVVQFSLHGYAPGNSRAVLRAVVTRYLHRHRQAPPRLMIDLPDTFEHQIDVGDTVSVTSDHLVDLSAGTRGVTDYTYIVAAKDADDFSVRVVLLNQNGSLRVASISPAIEIMVKHSTTVWGVGASGGSNFTDSGHFSGISNDKDWFEALYICRFIDGDGLEEVTGWHQISSIDLVGGTYRITIVPASNLAVVGDYLTFDKYTTALTRDGQKEYAFLSVDGKIDTSTDAPYIYVA